MSDHSEMVRIIAFNYLSDVEGLILSSEKNEQKRLCGRFNWSVERLASVSGLNRSCCLISRRSSGKVKSVK